MHTYVWGLNITSYTETKRCGSEVASDASCVYLAVSLPNVLYSKSWWVRASPNKVKRCSSCVYVHVTSLFLCMYASTSNYVLILQKRIPALVYAQNNGQLISYLLLEHHHGSNLCFNNII